jgi:hypothetical protein
MIKLKQMSDVLSEHSGPRKAPIRNENKKSL